MNNQKFISYQNTIIPYEVKRSPKRRTISLRVDAQGVTISAPITTSSENLQQLVSQRADWIIKHLNNLAQKLPPNHQFNNGDNLSYLGYQYPLKRIKSQEKVIYNQGFLEIPDLDNPDLIREKLQKWYIQQAQIEITARVKYFQNILEQHYSEKVKLSQPTILIRNQKTRWGSCNNKGELRFNWRIIMAPLTLVDYVVVHELCHLEHLNHSQAFWKLVEQILPDYTERKKQLAQIGYLLAF